VELALDPKKTALVVIDLQRGILALPAAPYTGDEVVERAAALCRAAREAGSTVVLVRVTPSADGRDALRPLADAPMPAPAQLPAGWADLAPELGVQMGDVVITKRQWGAFYGTELDLQLRRRGVDTIILCGISANIGVESTARDAYERVYNLILVEDAIAARSAEEHAFVMRTVFPRIGRIRKTAEVLAALEARPASEARPAQESPPAP
jgi:nicotinamidase-related amidase